MVETFNNRIPTTIPGRGVSAEFRGGMSSADKGYDGATLFDAGAGNFAVHADAFGRTTQDYRVPHYPYLTAPDPADLPNATQPGAFNGRQPNSASITRGGSVGGSYIFNEGFLGLAVIQNSATYHIPGAEPESNNTRIDARQTKVMTKGEWRAPNDVIDALRFWGGLTDYKHNELGLEDPADLTSDTVHQTFTNKEQEGRVEAQLAPFNLRFASLTTAIGVQGGYQKLTAPSPDGIGLWDPNNNSRIAGYMFNEVKFSESTKAQIAGRIEQVNLSGTGREFDATGLISSTAVSPALHAEERQHRPDPGSAARPRRQHHGAICRTRPQARRTVLAAAATMRPSPSTKATRTSVSRPPARSKSACRRTKGPFRFEATAYITKFKGFIYRRLTGDTCDDAGVCGAWGGRAQRGDLFAGRRHLPRRRIPEPMGPAAARRRPVRHREPVRCRARHVLGWQQCAAHSSGPARRRRLLARCQLVRAREAVACLRAEQCRDDRRDDDVGLRRPCAPK